MKSWISAVCLVGSVMVAAQTEKPPDPKELAVVQGIRARIEEHTKKAATGKPAPYSVTIPETTVSYSMVPVPGGEFRMGSAGPSARPDEQPQHPVKVDPFWMQAHEVTWDAYLLFMFADQANERSHPDATVDALSRPTAPYVEMSFGRGLKGFPAISMTQHAANKFAEWLSAKTGEFYRLPTEAEWEYAAKGTDGRRYPWGNFDKRGDLANFADKNTSFAWSDRQIDDGYAESAPVGSFPRGASPFGIEDMSGNIWEWCSNFFEQYKPTPKTDPHGPPSGTKRVYRGGSWKSRFASLRTTTRSANLPNFSCNDLGFRIVCECES